MFEVVIRCEGGEFLSITLFGRSHADITDYWDGNWVRANVEVSAGGFRGEVSGDLRAEELATFSEQMTRLQESLQGEAMFNTMEGWLSLRVVGNGRGHMTFYCMIQDEPGVGNTLECVLATDQTFTQSTVAQLATVVQAIPVVGTP